MPGMSPRSRLYETRMAFWLWLAHRLPRELAYWSFIDTGGRYMGENVVDPEVHYDDVLARISRQVER